MNEVAIASVIGAGIFGGALALSHFMSASQDDSDRTAAAERPPAAVFSHVGADGAEAYGKYCARCHGPAGQGGDLGPPLVHRLYDLGERSDSIYLSAIRFGAPERRWDFGPMPPVRGVSERDAIAIIGFVAALQGHSPR